MIGETVTHYRIVDKVGEGGMGVVYRAEDTRLGRPVAVKFLSPRLLADAVAVERFQREARAASSLNHPHIAAIYDIGKHNNVPFLVMELLDGTTLRRRCSGHPLPTDVLLDDATQAATAATQRTRPASSIARSSRPTSSSPIAVRSKILDFGLAKLTEPQSRLGPTTPIRRSRRRPPRRLRPRERWARRPTCSPEQARRRKPSTKRSASRSVRRRALRRWSSPDASPSPDARWRSSSMRFPATDAAAAQRAQPAGPCRAGLHQHLKALEKDRRPSVTRRRPSFAPTSKPGRSAKAIAGYAHMRTMVTQVHRRAARGRDAAAVAATTLAAGGPFAYVGIWYLGAAAGCSVAAPRRWPPTMFRRTGDHDSLGGRAALFYGGWRRGGDRDLHSMADEEHS